MAAAGSAAAVKAAAAAAARRAPAVVILDDRVWALSRAQRVGMGTISQGPLRVWVPASSTPSSSVS